MALSLLTIIPTTLIFALPLASNPLSLGIWILFTALSIALLLALFVSTWLGMICFLIYVGGMMVMFSYFTALTPNYHLNIKNMLSFSCLAFFATIPSVMAFDVTSLPSFAASTPLMFFYTTESMGLLFFLGIMLFLTLIAVVKLSHMPSGPLRPFSK